MKRFTFALLVIPVLISGCGLLGQLFPIQSGRGTVDPISGGAVTDLVSLVDNLRALGASVEPADDIEQVFFSVIGHIIRVNGEDVQVFEYADRAAANSAAALIAPDAGSIGTSMISWVATPHVYKSGRLIVLYIGDNRDITALLQNVLGPQFAGR